MLTKKINKTSFASLNFTKNKKKTLILKKCFFIQTSVSIKFDPVKLFPIFSLVNWFSLYTCLNLLFFFKFWFIYCFVFFFLLFISIAFINWLICGSYVLHFYLLVFLCTKKKLKQEAQQTSLEIDNRFFEAYKEVRFSFTINKSVTQWWK